MLDRDPVGRPFDGVFGDSLVCRRKEIGARPRRAAQPPLLISATLCRTPKQCVPAVA